MNTYKYIGETTSGDKIEGTVKAVNQEQLESKLAERGVFLKSHFVIESSLLHHWHAQLKKSEVTRLTRQLSVLLSSGITIDEAIESIREQIDDKRLNRVFESVLKMIQSGQDVYKSFSAYAMYFNDLFVSLVYAGEISGTLDNSFERIATFREKTEEIKKKLKTALAYPILVLIVSALVLLILITYIIPIFSSMYANFGLELPVLTRHVVNTSNWLKEYYLSIIAALSILGILLFWILKADNTRLIVNKFALKAPLIKSINLKYASANFGRTLGVLLSSGVPLVKALKISINTISNSYIKYRLNKVSEDLAEGLSLSDSLKRSGVLPKTVIRMTAAGESTGRLGEMLLKTADFYDNEVKNDISTITSLIEPIIILILGLVVGFILIAMYLPLFELIGQMGY